jgi:hypothetical protein
VAKQLDVCRETVRRWVVQAEVDEGRRDGTTSQELAEIRRLRAENKRLREDVAIAKAAATIFLRGGTRPRATADPGLHRRHSSSAGIEDSCSSRDDRIPAGDPRVRLTPGDPHHPLRRARTHRRHEHAN